jgi:hypothetical protein
MTDESSTRVTTRVVLREKNCETLLAMLKNTCRKISNAVVLNCELFAAVLTRTSTTTPSVMSL